MADNRGVEDLFSVLIFDFMKTAESTAVTERLPLLVTHLL
jgi:hypothetical protein